MKGELKKLAADLYNEGYQCGISDDNSDKWFSAYADAMKEIVNGAKYSDDLVSECFNKQSA